MYIPYKKGTQFEYLIKAKLEQKGYFVVRSAGSKGLFDLIAFSPKSLDEKRLKNNCIYPDHHILAIQCKSVGRVSKEQIDEILDVAKTYGLIPMLATKFNHKPILVNLETKTVTLL